MSSDSRIQRKSYAMQRMARALERAVRTATVKDKERAARWAAAWGMLCGIKSSAVRLRRAEVSAEASNSLRRSSDQIEIPEEIAPLAVTTADPGNLKVADSPSQQPLPLGAAGAPIAAGIFDPSAPA